MYVYILNQCRLLFWGMNVCMCICAYGCIYIFFKYIFLYMIFLCGYVYIHVYVCICVCVCVCIYIYMYVCMYIYVYVYMCVHVYIFTYSPPVCNMIMWLLKVIGCTRYYIGASKQRGWIHMRTPLFRSLFFPFHFTNLCMCPPKHNQAALLLYTMRLNPEASCTNVLEESPYTWRPCQRALRPVRHRSR